MLDKAVQGFLSRLILAGHESPPSSFKRNALDLLSGLVPFDASIWISGRAPDGLASVKVHNVHVQGLPREMMESWDQIKGQDRLMAKVLANPGITIDAKDLYGSKERKETEVYQKHSGRWGIEAVICTAQPDEKTGLVEGISLYRQKAEPGFSEAERQTKQALFPLLIQVWHHNQIQQLKHSSCGTDVGAFAICDHQGWLRHMDDRFTEMIHKEFAGWHPPELPPSLVDWLSESDQSKYYGKLVTVECWEQNDLILLQARAKTGLDKLTSREKEVAESYAAGLTYKEIALELGVAPSTVRRHLESIFQKLEVSSKVELVHAIT